MQTTNAAGQRRHNLSVLARAIWQNPGISRRALLDRFAIDESSVSRLVGQLLDWGLIESTGTIEGGTVVGPAPGGRRRVALQVRPSFGQVWGVALWRDRYRITLADASGRSLAVAEHPVARYDGDWPAYIDAAVRAAHALAATHAPTLPLLGLGWGVPGWIDSEQARIVRSDEFGLVDVPCPSPWPAALPCLWENDANCGAWPGLGLRDPNTDELYVLGRFLEHGPLGLASELSIGFGLIVRGQLHRGWRHNAGEFLSSFWEHGRTAYAVDEAVYGRSKNDPAAFQATVRELLRNLRFASLLLDPQRIHLGGDLKDRAGAVVEACRALGWSAGEALLQPLPAGVDEVSLGAAQLVLDQLFGVPQRDQRSLFSGYGTGEHDPLWRGLALERLASTKPVMP